ncbi:ArgE/DapE family deacylase [Geomicrobium sediminis]|uniref:Probable succinyl-diaminopimelate desuccinylase n=1 Tax=Geomicrobium sediminis TaxID=1347788 RepID=A0ABS2P8A2_9BACL|nr:succinyl-diaminopimelate desuccinylase [Geomicrobium sediminis]
MINDSIAIQALKEVLEMDTSNPPGNEELVANKLQFIFTEYGIETTAIAHSAGRTNLIATLPGDGSTDEVIGLSGHMDVVPPGDVPWDSLPFDPVEVDGKIYARGACDMKSGLMAAVAVLCRIKHEGIKLPFDLKLFASIGEERGAIGAKQLTEEGYTDCLSAMIITEPTNGRVITSHKGALWLRITTHGKTAHGSKPERGVNALMHLISIVNELQRALRFDANDEKLGRPSFSFNVMNSGKNTNMVPDQSSVEIDIRTLPGQSHASIVQDIKNHIQHVRAQHPELQASVEVINDLPPLETDDHHQFVEFACEHLNSRTFGMSGYTDGSRYQMGTSDYPIIVWSGIEGSTAHQPNEVVYIDHYTKTIEQLQSLLMAYKPSEDSSTVRKKA